MSGLPALPMAAMRPSFRPMSALTMPQWSRMRALVSTQSTAPPDYPAVRWLLRHAVADGFAAAELDLFAVAARSQGVVFFDLNDQAGICQAHAVASGGAEDFRVGAASDGCHIQRLPCIRPRKP